MSRETHGNQSIAPVRQPATEPEREWALRYLTGRVLAFRRGNVSLATVAGAVRLAMRRGVPLVEIREALAAGHLRCAGDGAVQGPPPLTSE
jgi:hypothetical protein